MATTVRPPERWARPWIAEIRVLGRKRAMEKRPRVTITLGLMALICRSRYCEQDSISGACGARLPGGRHLTMLGMKTCSRVRPTLAHKFSKTDPAAPTNG